MSKSSYLTNEELLENIARDLTEMHRETGIDLAYWDTALEIVRRFYDVKVDVIVRDRRNV
jgi:thermostable 8-oxoguanine DNA glycosylase